MPYASDWAYYIRCAGQARFADHHTGDECSRIVHGQFAAACDRCALEVSLLLRKLPETAQREAKHSQIVNQASSLNSRESGKAASVETNNLT